MGAPAENPVSEVSCAALLNEGLDVRVGLTILCTVYSRTLFTRDLHHCLIECIILSEHVMLVESTTAVVPVSTCGRASVPTLGLSAQLMNLRDDCSALVCSLIHPVQQKQKSDMLA